MLRGPAGSRDPSARVVRNLRISQGEESWPVEVSIVEGLGADAYVYSDVKLTGGATKQIVARTDGRTPPRRGEMMGIEILPHHMHLFDPDTGERLHYT